MLARRFLPLTAEPADEIMRETLVTLGGHIVHARVAECGADSCRGTA